MQDGRCGATEKQCEHSSHSMMLHKLTFEWRTEYLSINWDSGTILCKNLICFEIISKDKKEVSVIIKLVSLAVSSVHNILAMYKKLIFMQQNYKFPNKAQKFFHI